MITIEPIPGSVSSRMEIREGERNINLFQCISCDSVAHMPSPKELPFAHQL
ncbi:rCG62390, partial [Rattus norvegicus]